MIERIGTVPRMSAIVKHNGTIYLAGQVGEGDTVADQTKDCLAQIDDLLAIGVNCISEGMSASVREAQALRPSDPNPQSFKHRALFPQFRQNRGSVTDGSIFEEFDIAISAVERS